jgi:ribonuclease E
VTEPPPAPSFALEPTGPSEGPLEDEDIDEIGVTEGPETAEGADEGTTRRSRRGRRGGRRRRSSRVAAESGSDAATPAAEGSDAEPGAPVEPLPATPPPSISLAATDSPVAPEADRPADDSPPRGTV